MCVVCVVISFILGFRLLVNVPARVTQEEGHTDFLHLASAVLALIFIARRIQPFLSLVGRKVELLCTRRINRSSIVGHDFRKSPSSSDPTEIQTHVPTSEDFEVTN